MKRRLAAVLACALGVASPAAAQLPAPSFTEFTNVPGLSLFPDSRNTRIFVSAYLANGALETVISGRAPRARYFSLAILDQALREIAAINDTQIDIDAHGAFTVVVRQRCGAARNCLTAGSAALPARIYYRIYVPRRDDCGSVGVPGIAYRPAGSDALPRPTSACAPRLPGLPPLRGGFQARVISAGPPPRVFRFDAGSESGTGGTADNAYVYFSYDLRRGNVVVTARVPTYRRQRPGDRRRLARGDGSEQVRYWSLCTTQTSRPIDCLRDDEVVTRGARATFLIAASCPAAGYPNCLEGGPLALGPGASGASLDLAAAATTTLVYRNLLARSDFATPAGPERCPAGDVQYCGAYAPRVAYVPRPTPAP